MTRPMTGIRVIELAAWTFVPAAGAVLGEWGADVIKIEHPQGGDPQRGLVASGMVPASSVNYLIEQPNHNKRSLGLDLGVPEGREVLLELVRDADVFLTNWLPDARARLGVEVDDIRAVNPHIVYVRGSGQGQHGPDARKGGYDGSAFWARSGLVDALTRDPGDPYGPQQTPALGDLAGAQTIAGGIAAALLHRERTGEATVVDVSLLGLGMWMMSPVLVAAKTTTGSARSFTRADAPNPIANRYLTADGRVVHLVMLQTDRFWPELVAAIGRPELAEDDRFSSPERIFEHREEAIRILDEVFAARPLDHWREALAGVSGVWAAAQNPLEVLDDPQAVANGYVADVAAEDGDRFPLIRNPVQFDDRPTDVVRAPGAGEHTDEVLLEAGYDMDRIIELKIAGAVQ